MNRRDYVAAFSEMAFLVVAALLLLGYVEAQNPDADCNFRQFIETSKTYYIDENYRPVRRCRYILNCSAGFYIRAVCRISVALSNGCTRDRFLVSKSDDPTLTGADAYCGNRIFTVQSTNVNMVLALIAEVASGRIQCNITSQLMPTTTTPSSMCRCGDIKQNRIVGGQETRPDEYPFKAAMIERSTGLIHCGAVIISDRHVLSAAHCVYNGTSRGPQRLETYLIVVDVYNVENNSGTSYTINTIIIHENFNPDTYDFDISVILVQGVFSSKVQPVCLPFKYTNNEPPAGTQVIVTGWGLTEPGGMTSPTLRSVNLTLISRSVCARTEPDITDRQTCTYTRGKDACQYDSGGPMLLMSNVNVFTIGITSRGDSCAGLRPGVYTNVIPLLPWIVNNVKYQFCIKR